jgi:NADH-quinone oxidoreductase subunit C
MGPSDVGWVQGRSVITIEQAVARLKAAVPGARLEVIPNPAVGVQPSLRVDRAHAVAAAVFLKETQGFRFDYISNVTGVDWLDRVHKEKVKVRRTVDGVEGEFEDTLEIRRAGYLEAVYHLFSVELRHGPLVLRMRTENRTDRVRLPSLTPVWRGCELQEREVFDLYGIQFEGHPDLRRLLMWEGFVDHPMRKDYVEPDDYEYEPTPHDEVLERVRRRQQSGGEGMR